MWSRQFGPVIRPGPHWQRPLVQDAGYKAGLEGGKQVCIAYGMFGGRQFHPEGM